MSRHHLTSFQTTTCNMVTKLLEILFLSCETVILTVAATIVVNCIARLSEKISNYHVAFVWLANSLMLFPL